MNRRKDTRRAVEILSRYQGTLCSPAEEPLQVSLEKVLHIFKSELFQALLDIQECYELSLLSAYEEDGKAIHLSRTLGNGVPKSCPEKPNQEQEAEALQVAVSSQEKQTSPVSPLSLRCLTLGNE
nr:disks large 1 tumor suppressor protein-like [Anolis sagrei ordinatus]